MISIIVGGHNLSDRANELIATKKGLSVNDFTDSLPKYYNGFSNKAPKDVIIFRSDPDIVETIKTLKKFAFCNTWYKPSIALINKEFVDFIEINDYEGHESITIDFPNYTIKKISQINNDTTLNCEQKRDIINRLCNTKYVSDEYIKYLDY